MLSLHEVSKEYNFRRILDDITFTLQPGLRYVLTGENGLGKTTLLKVMSGLARPTKGKVLWKNRPIEAKHRGELGVVMQHPFLFGDLTGSENLQFYAALYGCEKPKMVAQKWIDLFELSDARDMLVKEYSKGMKQRLSLSRALLHKPSVLLLDEPYDGLDGKSANTLKQILEDETSRDATIFLVTHQLYHLLGDDLHLTLRNGCLVNAS